MEVKAVAHALRWIASRGDSQTTHAIVLTDSMNLLQKVKSGMGSPDWHVSMVYIHLRSCGCTALDMPERRETTELTDWWANQLSQVACSSEDVNLLIALSFAHEQTHCTYM